MSLSSLSLSLLCSTLPRIAQNTTLPIKRGLGPTTDVTITSWCTGCWSNVVASGVYRCTSARSTDFTKAFDRIKHSALWSSLQFYGVKPAYVRLLQRLYSQQRRNSSDLQKETDAFPIKRGTKQGDPLSSLLFNTVLQYHATENDYCYERYVLELIKSVMFVFFFATLLFWN